MDIVVYFIQNIIKKHAEIVDQCVACRGRQHHCSTQYNTWRENDGDNSTVCEVHYCTQEIIRN